MEKHNVEINMVQYASINHPCTYYCDTKLGPVVTEEFACVEAAEKLLFDNNSNFSPNDQAIFAEQFNWWWYM